MGENGGSDVESEFASVTSSQISFLKNCPLADPNSHLTKSLVGVEDTDSHSTEVLQTPISPPVTHTPVLSLSTPISLDSINDEDVFRTPPENASLSSAAESEPRARVSEIKPPRGGGGSELKSPSKTTPVSASASLTVRNVRVLETNRIAAVTPLTSPPSFAAGNVKVPGGGSELKSPSPVRVLEVNRPSDPKEPVTKEVTPLSSSPSLGASSVRAPEKPCDSSSPRKQPDLDSSSQSATEGIKVSDYETEIPFKEVMEALLRNNGENLEGRDGRVSYVDILKQCGLKFP